MSYLADILENKQNNIQMKFSTKSQVKAFFLENKVNPFDSVFYGSSTVDNIQIQDEFEDEEHEECYHLDIEDIKKFIQTLKSSVLEFGELKGQTLYNILKNDHSYFEWLVDDTVIKNEVAAWDFAVKNL